MYFLLQKKYAINNLEGHDSSNSKQYNAFDVGEKYDDTSQCVVS